MGGKGKKHPRCWEDRYDVDPVSGCFVWNRSVVEDGYPRYSVKQDGRWVCAPGHRMAWEMANGPVPEGMSVRHKCDNPSCVNPDHLEVGTQADNMKDMQDRGRHRAGIRLKPSEVREVRFMLEVLEMSVTQIALQLGRTRTCVRDIKSRRTHAALST